jgi:uncharacterized membrane protein
MKRVTVPVIIGLLIIMCGGLLLMRAADILTAYSRWFWASVFAAGGILFLIQILNRALWSAFPGFPLLGISAAIAVSEYSEPFAMAAFFIVSSASFVMVYLFNKEANWWGIITAGILVSLGISTGLQDYVNGAVGFGIFSLGMSITFVALILLSRTDLWAYISAGGLAVLGAICIAAGNSAKAVLYVCAAILIITGAFLIVKNFMNRKTQTKRK